MRTTRVMAFSVPPSLEAQIQKHAKEEHRTLSEYLREAVRQYMDLREFDKTQKAVAKKMKKKGRTVSDVHAAVRALRKNT